MQQKSIQQKAKICIIQLTFFSPKSIFITNNGDLINNSAMRDLINLITQLSESTEVKFNKGDVAEVVLGAAMTAKFRKTDDSEVTEAEVTQIIREVVSTKSIEYDRPDIVKAKKVFDEITFKIGVPKKAMEFLKQEDLSKVVDLFQSALGYINSDKRLDRQAKILRSNAKVDSIIVNSDGVGDQKGTKADIKLTVNGKQTRNQISLKVTGGEQFAQVSGVGFDKQKALWKDGLGLDIEPLEQEYDEAMEDFDSGLKFFSRDEPEAQEQKQIVKTAMRIVYQEAANKLNDLLKTKDEEFLKGLNDFISKGIAGEEQQYIELVKLDKGSFKSIRPGSKAFKQLMSKFDLVAEIRETGDPLITIKDTNTDKPLITIRAKIELASSNTKEGKTYRVYPRNYIEAPKNSILYSTESEMSDEKDTDDKTQDEEDFEKAADRIAKGAKPRPSTTKKKVGNVGRAKRK